MWTWFCSTGLLVFLLDRITKYFVMTNMDLTETIPIIRDFFHITYVKNPGAAFGMMQDKKWFFVFVTLVIIGVIIYLVFTMGRQNRLLSLTLGLVTGGAAGNLADRLHSGLVIDFIDFRGIWPYIFNIADSAIVVGALLLAIQILRMEKA